MKKILRLFFIATIFLFACETHKPKTIKVEGDWKFSEHVKGKAELNNQNQAMINSIVSLFENGTISMKEGKVTMKSPKAGSRSGTYTIQNGKLDIDFGSNSQISLHVTNEGPTLVVLFNEDGQEETGKIVLKKQ